jgi:hypothetical protein
MALAGRLADAGHIIAAIANYKIAVAMFMTVGDVTGEATALDNLGTLLRQIGRYDEAIAAHHQAALAFRATGDVHGETMAMNNMEKARAEQQANP